MVSASAQEVPDPEFQAAWSEPAAREAFRHSAGLRIAEHLYQARTRVLSLAVLQITWQLRKCRPLPTPSSTPGPLTPRSTVGLPQALSAVALSSSAGTSRKGPDPRPGWPRGRTREHGTPSRRAQAETGARERGGSDVCSRLRPPQWRRRRTRQKGLCIPQGWGASCTPAEVSRKHQQGVGRTKTRDMAGPQSSPPSAQKQFRRKRRLRKARPEAPSATKQNTGEGGRR